MNDNDDIVTNDATQKYHNQIKATWIDMCFDTITQRILYAMFK